jgi:hypothetical protein
MSSDLPPEIRRFISQYLRSVEQLEILLLVSRGGDSAWSVQSVYDVILSSKASVERWLEVFAELGFLQKIQEGPTTTYRFTATGEKAAIVQRLDALYKLKPVRILEAIFKKDQDPAQSFADAFKLRKQP